MKPKRILPTFQCETCGNCEKFFHHDEQYHDKLGFCLRFKENVDLSEKNLRCWSEKPNEHYKQLFLQVEKTKTANQHIVKKQAEQLNLFFDNENPFI